MEYFDWEVAVFEKDTEAGILGGSLGETVWRCLRRQFTLCRCEAHEGIQSCCVGVVCVWV